MQYSVVFAVSSDANPAQNEPLIFIALLAVALCGFAVWLSVYKRNAPLMPKARFYSIGIAIGLCVILFALNGIKSDHDRLLESVNTGRVQVAEGVVERFHPMPVGGHDTERFIVAGQQFEYSDYEVTGGFNNSASHGGPIRVGLPVRITFVPGSYNNVIVKLEIGHV